MTLRANKMSCLLAGLLVASVAVADLFVSGDINQAIPDGSELGVSDTITVSGIGNSVTNISISLVISGTDSGAYNGDIYAYVRLGNDVNAPLAVLLNRVGKTSANPYGSSDDGFDVTFSLTGSDIHNAAPVGGTLTGEWAADGRETDPADVLDTDTRTALLNNFLGANPNGDWTLFVADLEGGGTARVDSWGINVDAIPEPAAMTMVLGAGLGFLFLKRRFTK